MVLLWSHVDLVFNRVNPDSYLQQRVLQEPQAIAVKSLVWKEMRDGCDGERLTDWLLMTS